MDLMDILNETTPKPKKHIIDDAGTIMLNPNFNTWLLIDQNLAAAIYSTVSSQLLPYIL